MQGNDHDLLIELRTEVRGMREDIKLMRDDIIRRLTDVENNKVSYRDFQEYKTEVAAELKRLDDLPKQNAKKVDKLTIIVYTGVGILVALEFVIGLLK